MLCNAEQTHQFWTHLPSTFSRSSSCEFSQKPRHRQAGEMAEKPHLDDARRTSGGVTRVLLSTQWSASWHRLGSAMLCPDDEPWERVLARAGALLGCACERLFVHARGGYYEVTASEMLRPDDCLVSELEAVRPRSHPEAGQTSPHRDDSNPHSPPLGEAPFQCALPLASSCGKPAGRVAGVDYLGAEVHRAASHCTAPHSITPHCTAPHLIAVHPSCPTRPQPIPPHLTSLNFMRTTRRQTSWNGTLAMPASARKRVSSLSVCRSPSY